MASKHDTIVGLIHQVVSGLDLTPIEADNVLRRMLPRVDESLETMPCVLVCKSQTPVRITPISFEDDVAIAKTYGVEIVTVAANNLDLVSNDAVYGGWQEKIQRAFQPQVIPGLDGVAGVELRPAPPYDRRLLNQQYAYSGLEVLVTVWEQRGN